MEKSLKVLESTLRLKIKESIIDYKISYDITGKVYKTTPLIFQLPEIAQQLVLGKNREEMIVKIYALEGMIQLILPLGIVGQLPFLKEELKEILKKIKKERKKKDIDKKAVFLLAEKESLEYYVLSSFMNPARYPDDFKEMWEKLANILRDRDQKINSSDLEYFSLHYPQFGFKILPLIIPYLTDKSLKSEAYKRLGYFVDDQCKLYLIGALVKYKEDEMYGGILEGLSKQNIHEPHIQDTLIKFYHSEKIKDYYHIYLMKALRNIPNEKTFRLGREIVEQFKRQSCAEVSSLLLDIGYPPKQIADLMLPKLESGTPYESGIAFSVLSDSETLLKFLPKTEQVLEIFVKTLEKGPAYNISYSMVKIIKKRNNIFITSNIAKHLENDDPNVLKGVLLLINLLLYEHRIISKPFTTKFAKSRYLELLKHEDRKVAEGAIDIISKIGAREGKKEYIAHLLDIINESKGRSLNLKAMRAINEILPYTTYDPQITAIYLKMIENKYSSNYQKEALIGLRHCPDSKLKESLSYLKDHTSKDVRKAAELLLQPVEKLEQPNLLLRMLRFSYIEIKHNGKPPSQFDMLDNYFKEASAKRDIEMQKKLERFKLKH